MEISLLMALVAGFFCIAALYTSVGHAGASGYLALMALAAVAPETMRPTALLLNVLVGSLTVFRFYRGSQLNWHGLWPFLLGSVPLAVLGGVTVLPHAAYYALVGVVLLVAASALLWRAWTEPAQSPEAPIAVRVPGAVLIGAGIGLLSGLTGTGGGIFLSPVILFLGWAGPRATAGIAAPFILINSVVALLAGRFSTEVLPAELPILAAAAIAGGLLGNWLLLHHLSRRGLLTALAMVEVLACIKLFAFSVG